MRLTRLALIALMLGFLCGCVSYQYKSPDGRSLTITKFATDTKFGKLAATAPDGTKIEIENYDAEEKLTEVLNAIVQKLPITPVPIP